jgi:hypothetical protein
MNRASGRLIRYRYAPYKTDYPDHHAGHTLVEIVEDLATICQHKQPGRPVARITDTATVRIRVLLIAAWVIGFVHSMPSNTG